MLEGGLRCPGSSQPQASSSHKESQEAPADRNTCPRPTTPLRPELHKENILLPQLFRAGLTAAFLLSVSPTALRAQTMPVATFLSKADALKKRGPFALLSGDYGRLKAEVNNSAKALGAEQFAASKAGRRPATCMPNNISVGTDELLSHFRSIPGDQQRVSVKAAVLSFIKKKYPCPS